MLIEINGEQHNVPSDTANIALGKYAEWYSDYGQDFDKELTEILMTDYTDEFLKEDAVDRHLDKEALAWYSFFTGHDFKELEDTVLGAQVCDQYRLVRHLISESEREQEQDLLTPVEWRGETWQIQDYKVDPVSPMTFNEIITAKEAIRQLHKLGAGKWEALKYLCAIFFRKSGEAFDKKFMYPDSERAKIMNELPLSYALKVSFFLTNCVDIWRTTSAFSQVEAAKT